MEVSPELFRGILRLIFPGLLTYQTLINLWNKLLVYQWSLCHISVSSGHLVPPGKWQFFSGFLLDISSGILLRISFGPLFRAFSLELFLVLFSIFFWDSTRRHSLMKFVKKFFKGFVLYWILEFRPDFLTRFSRNSFKDPVRFFFWNSSRSLWYFSKCYNWISSWIFYWASASSCVLSVDLSKILKASNWEIPECSTEEFPKRISGET